MPPYLYQAAYTPESLAAQIKNPQDRVKAVEPVLKSFGGRFVGAWLAFGEYDVVAICEAPDQISQSAFSIAAYAPNRTSCMTRPGSRVRPPASSSAPMKKLIMARLCAFTRPVRAARTADGRPTNTHNESKWMGLNGPMISMP